MEDVSPKQYADELSNEQTRLAKLEIKGELENSVEASINLSYKCLSRAASRLFLRLSVFPSDFDAKAEESICQDKDHKQLSELLRFSMVDYQKSTGRYSLHDLVRLFAQARLKKEDFAVVKLRHAEYYKNLLNDSRMLFKQGGENLLDGLRLFDQEWSNIRAGQAWAADFLCQTKPLHSADVDSLYKSALLLSNEYPETGAYVLRLRMHPKERIHWLEIGLSAARALNDHKMMGLHQGNLGIAYNEIGNTLKAIECFERELMVHRSLGDLEGEGNALGNLGITYNILGDTRKAIDFHRKQLMIARKINDLDGKGNALCNLGSDFRKIGDNQRAVRLLTHALEIHRGVGNLRGEAVDLSYLASCYRDLGTISRAIEFSIQQLDITRNIRDSRGEIAALNRLGSIYADLGNINKSNQFYEMAQTIDHDSNSLKKEK
jgi:tetratricopeptide (TPR) repeat protein